MAASGRNNHIVTDPNIVSNRYPFRNTCIVANSGKISNYKIRGDQDVFPQLTASPT